MFMFFVLIFGGYRCDESVSLHMRGRAGVSALGGISS
jgi:hypothetical protein